MGVAGAVRRFAGFTSVRQTAVACQQGVLRRKVQSKFRVSGDACQFRQTFCVGESLQAPAVQPVRQRRRMRIGEMQ